MGGGDRADGSARAVREGIVTSAFKVVRLKDGAEFVGLGPEFLNEGVAGRTVLVEGVAEFMPLMDIEVIHAASVFDEDGHPLYEGDEIQLSATVVGKIVRLADGVFVVEGKDGKVEKALVRDEIITGKRVETPKEVKAEKPKETK